MKLGAMFLLLAVGLTAEARELADYRIGDSLEEDVIAPVPLMVVDAEATAALKAKENDRIPVIFRFDQTAAAVVESQLREKFTAARSNFLALMHRSFHHTRLEENAVRTEQFDKLMASFRKLDASFPLTPALAREWALGRDGSSEHALLVARVRAAMEQPIRYDNLTNAPKIGSRVVLIPVNGPAARLTLADVERGVTMPRTNMLTMSRARLALGGQYGSEEQMLARYAIRRLVENTFVETELTLAARARHTDPLFVADHYQAGQVVARQGELVDRKILAALTQIQEKTIAGRLQEQVTQQKQQAAQAQAAVTQVQQRNRMLFSGLMGASALLLVTVTWLVLRRKSGPVGLPAVISVSGSVGSPAEVAWQQRALQAEEQAERAQQAIRSGVMEQLKDKAVHSLATQRAEMLEAQRAAAVEMADLERRLNELQSPLQERLQAYQTRIAELERALAAKDAQNRELLRAKIELMRQQLELERTGDKLQFN
jgi:hypothetical protein